MTKARDLANGATALSAVSATELGYVDGVTSAIQTQMDAKLASATPVSAKTANYVLVAADKNTRVTMSNAGATTITVNTSLFAAGDTLFITNIANGACTITAGTATVSTASSLVLAQCDSGRLYFTSTGVAIWEKYQGAAATVYTPATTYASANVAISSTNTFFDIVSSAAVVSGGVYLVSGSILFSSQGSGGGGAAITAKIWNGTTIYNESGQMRATNGNADAQVVFPPFLFTAANTTALKISVAVNSLTDGVVVRNPSANSGSSNTSCFLTLQRIS